MKTKLVNVTSAEVEAHNSKHAVLIESGMMDKWEQSEQAKRDEVKRKAEAIKQDKEDRAFQTCMDIVNTLNEEAAKTAGLNPVKLYINKHYGSSGSMFRSGPFDGVMVEFRGLDGRYCPDVRPRLYKLNKDGQLVTKSLVKALDQHYAMLITVKFAEDEAKRKAEAAKQAMSPDLLKCIASAACKRVDELKVSMLDSGKIAVTYTYYSPAGYGRSRGSSYPVNVFTPCTVAQWIKWVSIQTAHSAALSALQAEINA